MGDDARRQSLIMHRDIAKFGHTLLNERQIANATGAKQLPKLSQLAAAVDEYWGDRLIGAPETGGAGGPTLTMRGLYTFIYRPWSASAHLQPETREPYGAWENVNPKVVDRPSKDEPSIWWPQVVPLYANALIACHDRLNWPSADRVPEIANAMYLDP